MKAFEKFIIVLCCGVIILSLFMIGWSYSEVKWQQAAIAAGVARWTINSQTGEKKFEYLKPEVKP